MYLACPGTDKRIAVWHANSLELKGFLTGHTECVTGLCFTTDGSSRLISCSDDATVRIWDVEAMVETKCFLQRGYVSSVSINSENDHFVCLVGSSEVYIWDITTSYSRQLIDIFDDCFAVAYWFIGNNRIVGCQSVHQLAVWDADSGLQLQVATCPEERILLLAVNPEGSMLACVIARSLVLWDINTMNELKTLQGYMLAPVDIRFSSDGFKLVSGGGDLYLNVWTVSSGLLLIRIIMDFSIRSVTFTADGTRVIVVLFDGTARIHDAENGNEMMRLVQAGFQMYQHVCVSPSTYVLM
jgi:WD40 repeat protein